MTLKSFSLLAAFFLIFLSACSTAPKKVVGNDFKTARWSTKLRVKDVEKNKSNTLSVDILGERGGSMRLEVSAVMGVPVASYVMTSNSFACALYRQKLFYEGPLSEEAMKPLIRVPISPQILSRIAFDEPITGSDWKCQSDAKGLPSQCASASKKLTIAWKRVDDSKTVRLEGQGFEMDWVFGAPSTEVQFKEGSFQLSQPSGFRLVRLSK